MFDASVLVWRIWFQFVTGAGMLLELFVSTIMNTKLIKKHQAERNAPTFQKSKTHRLRPARR
jgi:hypothetical protein